MEEFTIDNDNQLYLKWINNEMGWGVFTRNEIKKGQPIEFCYYYPISTVLPEYDVFVFDVKGHKCILFGYGSIYNHSFDANGEWMLLNDNKHILAFFAKRDIKVGEEITHNYGKNYWKHKSHKGKTII